MTAAALLIMMVTLLCGGSALQSACGNIHATVTALPAVTVEEEPGAKVATMEVTRGADVLDALAVRLAVAAIELVMVGVLGGEEEVEDAAGLGLMLLITTVLLLRADPSEVEPLGDVEREGEGDAEDDSETEGDGLDDREDERELDGDLDGLRVGAGERDSAADISTDPGSTSASELGDADSEAVADDDDEVVADADADGEADGEGEELGEAKFEGDTEVLGEMDVLLLVDGVTLVVLVLDGVALGARNWSMTCSDHRHEAEKSKLQIDREDCTSQPQAEAICPAG